MWLLSNWEYYRCFNENVRMACARKINKSLENVIKICILNGSFLSLWNFEQNFKSTNCFDAIIGKFVFILLFLPVTKLFDKTVDCFHHCFENWDRKWIVVIGAIRPATERRMKHFIDFQLQQSKWDVPFSWIMNTSRR